MQNQRKMQMHFNTQVKTVQHHFHKLLKKSYLDQTGGKRTSVLGIKEEIIFMSQDVNES